jgi:hypothetical protein
MFVPTARATARAQGAYYVLSGVWPLVHMRSFLWVTGPKAELWLVRTVGWLVTMIGAALLVGSERGERVSAEAAVLGGGSAAALAGLEAREVARRRISPVYGLDAVAQAALSVAWARGLRRARGSRPG